MEGPRDRDERSGAVLGPEDQARPAEGGTGHVPTTSPIDVAEPFEALARRFRERQDGVSSEYLELRRGLPGVVRTDITPAQLSGLLNDQLMQYSPADVKTIIDNFPERSREFAQFVLSKAAGFASIESLKDLATAVEGETLLLASPGSLAENLSYTCNRKNLFGSLRVETTDSLGNATALLLDKAALERLERDPIFARHVAQGGLKLVNPRGFVSGINLFNAVTPAEIQSHVSTVLLSAITYQSQSSKELGFGAAVDLALDTDMIERLLKAGELAGVGDKLLTQVVHVEAHDPGSNVASTGTKKVTLTGSGGEIVTLDYSNEDLQTLLASNHPETPQEARDTVQPGPLAGVEIPDVTSIARRLNGLRGMSASQVEHELNKIPEGYRASASELVARSSVVCSPRTLAYELREMHGSIQAEARSRGVPTDNIYYLVPEAKKSYGMVAMAYMLANEVRSDRLITSASEASKDSMIIILDDVSGSGLSLRSSLGSVRGYGSSGALAAPIVATSSSLKSFAHIPHKVIGTLAESDLMKGLEPYQDRILTSMVGRTGYINKALCVSFAYMSPDNNCGFWSTHFAPYLTVSPRAVKGTHYAPPDEQTGRLIAKPALTKTLAEAAQLLKRAEVDFPQEIACVRTLDALVSVAVQFRMPLSEDQQSIATQLRERLSAHCGILVQRAEKALEKGRRSSDFSSVASALVDLDRAETYLTLQRRDQGSAELLGRVKARATDLSQHIAGTFETEVITISQNLDESITDISKLSEVCRRTGDLRKVATIVGRRSDMLTRVQEVQRSVFQRAVTGFQAQQSSLSQALASPPDVPAISEAFATLTHSLQSVTEILEATVPEGEALEWGIAKEISETLKRNTKLQGVTSAWQQLLAFEGHVDATVSLKELGSLITDFRNDGKIADVSPEIFIDRAVKLAEQTLSRAAVEGTRALQQGTLAAAVRARALAIRNTEELAILKKTTGRTLEGMTTTLDQALKAGTEALEKRVPLAIEGLRTLNLQDEWYGWETRETVNALTELSADPSLPPEMSDNIESVWKALRRKVTAAAREILPGVFRGEKPGSALKELDSALKLLQIDSKSKVKVASTTAAIAAILSYQHKAELAQRPISTESRLELYVDLVAEIIPKLASYPLLRADIPSKREQLCTDIYRIIKPYLDFANEISDHAPRDFLSVLKILPRVTELFPEEERAEIRSALTQRNRYVQLARDFFENKVPDLMGATLSADQITGHALELAAVLGLVDDLDETLQSKFVVEKIMASQFFAKAVQRSLEQDPSAIGPEQAEAIRLLYQYDQGQGFYVEMSLCGFDRSGNQTTDRQKPAWASSDSDFDMMKRLGEYTDLKSALTRTAEERRASINAVLGQVTKFLGQTSSGFSSTSTTVLDTLSEGTEGESALATYLSHYT